MNVRTSVTKCTIMHRQQTAGSKSANLCRYMQADRVDQFSSKSSTYLTFIFGIDDSNRVYLEGSCGAVRTNTYYEVECGISTDVFAVDLDIFNS